MVVMSEMITPMGSIVRVAVPVIAEALDVSAVVTVMVNVPTLLTVRLLSFTVPSPVTGVIV